MPRPGPRPYECVRRAWHSDRHQPIRGSIIQELFRVANESHSPATRKNKEWQEKLPFVVFKAEEIMYSKANSEAEYMDLQTLWERANDAIDTIIRRDDTTETGDLLQPCIEAALNLGCIPRRASRSQRHNSPRCYLSSSVTQEQVEVPSVSPGVADGNIQPHHQGLPLRLPVSVSPPSNFQNGARQFVAWYSTVGSPATANCGSYGSGSIAAPAFMQDRRVNVPISGHDFSPPSMEIAPSNSERHPCLPFESRSWSSSGQVYPIFNCSTQQTTESQTPFCKLPSLSCHAPNAARPSLLPMREVESCSLHNFLTVNNDERMPDKISHLGNRFDNTSEMECDLSLRLGPPLHTHFRSDRAWASEVEEMGSSSSHGRSKFHDSKCSSSSFESIRCSR